jgi:hypothetical protein
MHRTVSFALVLIAGCGLLAAAQQPSVLPMGPAASAAPASRPRTRCWYKNEDAASPC